MGQSLYIHHHIKMPMSKEQGEKGQHGYTICQVVIGIIMIALGSSFADNCPNGATNYLFNAGIVVLVANLVALLAVGAKILAEKDGKVTCMETMGLLFINIISGCLIIANFVVLLWGSVVVFGRYGVWTDRTEDIGNENYCAYTPFMAAFIILIMNWLMLPLLCMCACLSIICKACVKS